MENVSNMNLNDFGSGDSMTPLFSGSAGQPVPEQKLIEKHKQQQQDTKTQNLVYKPDVETIPEKNIVKSKAMDSTPLSDVMMSGGDSYGDLPSVPGGGGPDSRFMMAQQPSYVQQVMPTPMGYQQQPQSKKATDGKNPFNLTDDQMEALLAGIVAILAFSGFAQDKLSTMIPKFLDEAGKQTTLGMIITALLAAVLFYFGRKFVIKD